jgi:hypothetical protein
MELALPLCKPQIVRDQRSEGSQMSEEVRGQRFAAANPSFGGSDIRDQKSEVRSQKSDVKCQMSDVRWESKNQTPNFLIS